MTTNPDDFTLISSTGSTLLLNGVGFLVTAIPYGIYLVLLCFTIVVLCRKEGNVKAKLVLLLAIVTMFAISTFFVATYASIFLQGIKTILIDNVDEPVANKIIAYRNRFTVLSLSQPVMFFCEVVIGDYIVVWRAWVLWTENRRVVYPSVFLLLGSAASVISFLGCLVHFDWPLDLPPTCRALSISNYVLSIATNVLATAAIGYKVWIYRRVLREYLGTGGRPTATQKTLFLLLESGIVYTFLWFLQLFVVTSINELFQQASLSLSVQLVGIYPTLIIVLVYLQRSLWDPSGAPSLHLSNSTESVILASGTDVQLDNPRASYPRTARMLDDSPIGIPPTCGYQSHPNRSSHCSANPEVLANTHAGIPSKQLVPTAECAIVN